MVLVMGGWLLVWAGGFGGGWWLYNNWMVLGMCFWDGLMVFGDGWIVFGMGVWFLGWVADFGDELVVLRIGG